MTREAEEVTGHGCCGGESHQVVPEGADEVREMVREGYAQIAQRESSGVSSCCGVGAEWDYAKSIGYDEDELGAVPEGANLGLGCGNPSAIAALQPGEVVLDLGSGAGFDAFLAARQVGETGRVIGIDMTPEMLARARANAVKADMAGYVEFREGLIEKMPVVDESVDVIISNCVINLSPDKDAVFQEAYRVLKPGGRLAISDIALSEELDPEILELASGYIGCVSGALLADDYLGKLRDAGFEDITWTRASAEVLFATTGDPLVEDAIKAVGREKLERAAKSLWSYKISGTKPCAN